MPRTTSTAGSRRPWGRGMAEPGAGEVEAVDVAGWSCPLPLRNQQRIVLGHGGGGVLSSELVEYLFLPAFGDAARNATPTDAAVLELGGGRRLAFTTDTFVVRPLVFPGGTIGDLAVNGTVNDLAMRGAQPLALSTGFVLEEGLELDLLGQIASSMGAAARAAGVELVTGDTKVVEAGHGDGVYVNTAGVGLVADGVDLRPERARPGDVVLVSGPIGLHGVAVLSVREGLEFGTELRSDTAPLNGLVAALIAAVDDPADLLASLVSGGATLVACQMSMDVMGLRREEFARRRRNRRRRRVPRGGQTIGNDAVYLIAIAPRGWRRSLCHGLSRVRTG